MCLGVGSWFLHPLTHRHVWFIWPLWTTLSLLCQWGVDMKAVFEILPIYSLISSYLAINTSVFSSWNHWATSDEKNKTFWVFLKNKIICLWPIFTMWAWGWTQEKAQRGEKALRETIWVLSFTLASLYFPALFDSRRTLQIKCINTPFES